MSPDSWHRCSSRLSRSRSDNPSESTLTGTRGYTGCTFCHSQIPAPSPSVASRRQLVSFCMYSSMFLSYCRNQLHVIRTCFDLNTSVRVSIKTYHPLSSWTDDPVDRTAQELMSRCDPKLTSLTFHFQPCNWPPVPVPSQPVGHTWSSDRIHLFTSVTLIVWAHISPLFFRVCFVKGISLT